jgi:hypothetical protein
MEGDRARGKHAAPMETIRILFAQLSWTMGLRETTALEGAPQIKYVLFRSPLRAGHILFQIVRQPHLWN